MAFSATLICGSVALGQELKDKFLLFVQGTFDPVTLLSVGFNAGIDQAQNTDPAFGQGLQAMARGLERISLAKLLANFSKTLPTHIMFFRGSSLLPYGPWQSQETLSTCTRTRLRGLPGGRHAHVQCFGMARDGERGCAQQHIPSWQSPRVRTGSTGSRLRHSGRHGSLRTSRVLARDRPQVQAALARPAPARTARAQPSHQMNPRAVYRESCCFHWLEG